jgi:hypothetical protein
MTNQVSDDQFPAELPPSIRARKLPWNIGTIVSIRNVLINNILTKFDFEIAIFFPITFFLSLKHREFYMGAEVPEHRDAFEPIFGCSVSLLLRRAKRGGEFKCEKSFLNLTRLNIFNGTRYLHSISPIEEGLRKSLLGSLHFAPWPAPTRSTPREVA